MSRQTTEPKAPATNGPEVDSWRDGSIAELLGLTAAEEGLVRVRASLSRAVGEVRRRGGLSKDDLAQSLGVSPAEVVELESGDRSATIDGMLEALFSMGVSLEAAGNLVADRRIAEPPTDA